MLIIVEVNTKKNATPSVPSQTMINAPEILISEQSRTIRFEILIPHRLCWNLFLNLECFLDCDHSTLVINWLSIWLLSTYSSFLSEYHWLQVRFINVIKIMPYRLYITMYQISTETFEIEILYYLKTSQETTTTRRTRSFVSLDFEILCEF